MLAQYDFGKLNLAKPQFSFLWNGDNNSTHVGGFPWGIT